MMKPILFTLSVLLALCYHSAMAQVALEVKGQPFNDASYADIQGNPYLENEWLTGKIFLENKKSIEAALKFDIYSNRVLFQKDGQVMELKNNISGFTLNNVDREVSDISQPVFVNGYPPIGTQTANSIYQLIADGNVKLLKFYKKTISEDREYDSSLITREYRSVRFYYIYKNNTLQQIQPSKKSLLKLFQDHEKEVEDYFKANTIDFKSDVDLQKLFGWYNSLT